jgi:putative phosphoesterase
MKILVISDTHGREERLDRVLEMHKDSDMLIFLGDGIYDIQGKERNHRGGLFAGVLGNCDLFYSELKNQYPLEQLVSVGEYNILIMHGHTQGVKHGLTAAISKAVRIGADFLLFGHTHEPLEMYIPEGTEIGGETIKKPLRVLNPGSLGEARGRSPSYALINIRGKDILMSHGEIDY